MSVSPVGLVRVKLIAGGFTGLVAPGACGCEISDLAPCGDSELSGNGYINGCKPGFKHADPKGNAANWIVSTSADAPSDEQFEAWGDY